jgi:hypothetical protein
MLKIVLMMIDDFRFQMLIVVKKLKISAIMGVLGYLVTSQSRENFVIAPKKIIMKFRIWPTTQARQN